MTEELGIITRAQIGELGRGNSFWLDFNFPNGTGQSFGGYSIDHHGYIWKSIVADLTAIAEVKSWENLEGQEMLALYESDIIIGIKNPKTGKTFLIKDWALKINTVARMRGI